MDNNEKTISRPGAMHPFVERALNTLGYLILRQAYVSAAGGESPCTKEEGYTCTARDIYENFCGELSTYIYELNALIKEGNGLVYKTFRDRVRDELIEGIYLGFDSDVYKDLGLTQEELPGHYSKHLKDILTHYGATQKTIEYFEGCVSEALVKHQIKDATEEPARENTTWMGCEQRSAFWTPYEQYKEHIGKKFTILRQLGKEDGIDIEEVGTMFKIKLEGGVVIEAWPEELYENSCMVDGKVY